jgi:cytochrome c biogenesis protein
LAVQAPPTTRPDPEPGSPTPQLGELLRQAWREFRSMRTALVLLFAVAAASIFGSLFPQRPISPQRVEQYLLDHPAAGPLLDRLGMFDVFGSAWYTAVYVALLGALVACLLPRTRSLVRMLRSRPPRASARYARYHNHAVLAATVPPEQATEAARRVLGGRRYRLASHPGGELAAEKGYLREAGSLLFHVSFLLLLIGLAYGKGFGYRGQISVVEGEEATNARVNYDSFTPGRFFGPDRLPHFTLRLDDFANAFHPDGTPSRYAASLTAMDPAGRQLRRQTVTVNHPMTVDGVRVYQSDYGYAPVVRVTVKGRDGKPITPQDGPLLTLRDPATEVSNGAVKLPMLDPQIGLDVTMFTGLLTGDGPDGRPTLANDPRLVNPVLVVFGWRGELNADRAQSVFTLDRSGLRPLADRPLVIPLGGKRDLPGGLGTVAFTGVKQYSVLTLARDPGVPLVAAGAAMVLVGLLPSLYVTRRRVWVRAEPTPSGARVELAGLALQGKPAFAEEFRRLVAEVERALGRSPGGPTGVNLTADAAPPPARESGAARPETRSRPGGT